jgi:hypothetical protein
MCKHQDDELHMASQKDAYFKIPNKSQSQEIANLVVL